jgi:thioredoxin 1
MSDAKYVTGTDQNFKAEVLEWGHPVLVDFWAEWCGPCRMIAPALEELAREFEGRARIVKVNVDEQQELAMQYGIRSIPTLLFFQAGKVVDQIVGAAPKNTLASKLTNLVGVAK